MTAISMKAIVAIGYGAPDVLTVQEVDTPKPQAQELLVRVYATTATTADAMMRTGKPYVGRLFTGLGRPKHAIPGTGFAGVVEAVGEEVRNYQIGDRVFGGTTVGFSANAEYLTIPISGLVLHMPEQMSYGEGATFGDGPMTSLNFLKYIGQVQPGQQVLINGAAGSLGSAAVQLAKHFGAEVTGVCSSRNMGLVQSLGADHVIDYTQQDFTQLDQTYDMIYDTVGKSSYSQSRSVLRPDGQYLSPVLDFRLLFDMMWTNWFSAKKAKFAASGLKGDAELRDMLDELKALYVAGKLKLVIDRQFPLEKVAEAHRYIDAGRKKGNVIITVRS